MKIICISDDNTLIIGKKYSEAIDSYYEFNLTVGKVYEYFNIDNINWYQIIDDSGFKFYYPPCFFITIEDYRNKKLEDIGI
jgi:hypothetical protein